MITSNDKHNGHEIITQRMWNNGPHYAQLKCRDCNKWIQWLSRSDYKSVNQILYGKPTLTFRQQRELLND